MVECGKARATYHSSNTGAGSQRSPTKVLNHDNLLLRVCEGVNNGACGNAGFFVRVSSDLSQSQIHQAKQSERRAEGWRMLFKVILHANGMEPVFCFIVFLMAVCMYEKNWKKESFLMRVSSSGVYFSRLPLSLPLSDDDKTK